LSAHTAISPFIPKQITAAEIAFTYDVILLSVKSYALLSAIDDFAAAVGPQTVVVPVLNGMRHMDLLMERFGKCGVLGGVCFVATEMDPQGRIAQLADFQSLRYGELDGQNTERVEAVDQAFRSAGFDAAISTHIRQDMWQKWVQLASLGAITCLLRGNIGEIVAVPGGAELSLTALSECAAIAAAIRRPSPSLWKRAPDKPQPDHHWLRPCTAISQNVLRSKRIRFSAISSSADRSTTWLRQSSGRPLRVFRFISGDLNARRPSGLEARRNAEPCPI
jgi:2-dehydropantoate 2-reductase